MFAYHAYNVQIVTTSGLSLFASDSFTCSLSMFASDNLILFACSSYNVIFGFISIMMFCLLIMCTMFNLSLQVVYLCLLVIVLLVGCICLLVKTVLLGLVN